MIKKLLGALSWVLMVFWVGVAVIAMLLTISGRRSPDGPELFGYRFLVVLSDSMSPAVHAGDLIIAAPPNPAAIKPGDIVTYRDMGGARLITHRVVRVEGQASTPAFVTRGDANNVDDKNPVQAHSLVGVYRTHIPYAGYVVTFTRTWVGWLLLVVLPGLALLASEVKNLTGLAPDASRGPARAK